MSCWSSYPTLILDVSGNVVSCNEGLLRLINVRPTEEGRIAVRGCHASDLGIILLPGKNLMSSDWNKLLELTSNANKNEPDTDKHKPTSGLPKDLYELSEEFWNMEDNRLHVQELDVTVSCKIMNFALRDLENERHSILPIRARMRIHATKMQNTFRQVLIFRRYYHGHKEGNLPSSNESSPLDNQSGLKRLTIDEKGSSLSFGDILKSPDQNIHQMISKLIPSTLSILDTNGKVQYLSPSWYDFTGSTKDQSMDNEWAKSVHPDDIEPMLKSWVDVLQSGKHEWTTEARYRRYDGCYFWFLIRAQSVKDDSGQIVRWYASMIDVNAIVVARLDSERRRDSILKVLSQPDVSLWSLNHKHEISLLEGTLSWNTTGSDTPDKLHVMSGNLEQAVDKILTQGSTLETVEHGENGRWYRTRLVADLTHDTLERNASKPGIQGVLALTIDISDVKARTILQVENDRLSSIELAAREASKLKSQFLANVSKTTHDLVPGSSITYLDVS